MKIYQSYHGAAQQRRLSSTAIPFQILQKSPPDSREYELIKTIHRNRQDDLEEWGLVSWKFEHKTHIKLEDFYDFAKTMFTSGADCVFINPMIGNEALFLSTWEQWVWAHDYDRSMVVFEFINKLNIGDLEEPAGSKHFAFCNYFIANKRFYDQYFKYIDFILAALEREADHATSVGLIYKESAKYKKDESLTMRPFIVERLFSSFILNNKNLNCVPYYFSIELFRSKFGINIGNSLFTLSQLKNNALHSGSRKLLIEWDLKRKLILKDWGLMHTIAHLDDPFELPLMI